MHDPNAVTSSSRAAQLSSVPIGALPGTRAEGQEAANSWRERRQAALLPRAALQCAKTGDIEKLRDMMKAHGSRQLLMLPTSLDASSEVGLKSVQKGVPSMYRAALEEGHTATANFLCETVTDLLVSDLQQLVDVPRLRTSAFIQALFRQYLDAGADLSRPAESAQGLMPLHQLCLRTVSCGAVLAHSDPRRLVIAQIAELIVKAAPITLLCPTPDGKLPLQLAAENPSLRETLVPVLCEHMGSLIAKQPRLADSGMVQHAVHLATEHSKVVPVKHLYALVEAVASQNQSNSNRVLNPLAAYESWSQRHQRLALLQPLLNAIGVADQQCVNGEAAAQLAELKACLERERCEHHEQIVELTRALDVAQRAAEVAATHTKHTVIQKEAALRAERSAREISSISDHREASLARKPENMDTSRVSADSVDTQQVSTAEALIRRIRQQRGLDIDLASMPTVLVESTGAMQRSIGAAVERLSQDLYTSRSHFVLELIQNADDNTYAADVSPELQLILSTESQENYYFATVNNEAGLTQKDVEALCDINRSTKSHRSEQIGRKGLGWKSVFAVSDRPIVLSHEFQFCFNVRDLGRLGYVTPETLTDDVYGREIPTGLKQAHQRLATVLLLPLQTSETRSGVQSDVIHGSMLANVVREGINKLFADPAWLLFLRRVRCVAWEDQTLHPPRHVTMERTADKLIMRRSSAGAGTVDRQEICYFVHRKVFTAPAELCEGTCCDEEIIVAFRPPEAGGTLGVNAVQGETDSRQGRELVFCFLPVRSVGFRFLLHAPWVLTSNREDWHLEHPWNRWLRDCSAHALAEAITRFSCEFGDEVLHLLDARCVLDPFWRHLLADAATFLGNAPIVPIEGNGPAGSRFACPSEVLTPSPSMLQSRSAVHFLRMIPADKWPELTGKHLAQLPELTSDPGQVVQARALENARSLLDLGAEQLNLTRLKEVLNSDAMAETLTKPETFKLLLEVLSNFFDPKELLRPSTGTNSTTTAATSSHAGKHLADLVSELQHLQVFPLEVGDTDCGIVPLARLVDGDIFLPGVAGSWCRGLDQKTCASLSAHKGIRIFSRAVWNSLHASGRAFLQHQLHLREPTIGDIAAAVVRVHALQLSEAACVKLIPGTFMETAPGQNVEPYSARVLAVVWSGLEAVRVAREEILARQVAGTNSCETSEVPSQVCMPCLRGGSSPFSLDTSALSRVLWLPCARSACGDSEILLRRVHTLVLPSMLGVPVALPKASPTSGNCLGVCLEDDENLGALWGQQCPCMTLPGMGLEMRLQVESFLGDLGCLMVPKGWLESGDVAKMLVSDKLWRALSNSPFLRRHASRLLKKCSTWLPELIVPGLSESFHNTAVQDFFCRHVFEPIVGAGALPFVDVPEICVGLLEPLRIPARRTFVSLAKSMQCWTKQSPLPACVPESLCIALHAAALSSEEPPPPSALADLRKIIFVPGRGALDFNSVVWSTQGALASSICTYLRIPVLCRFYGEHLHHWFCHWLNVQVHPTMPHLIRALRQISGEHAGVQEEVHNAESNTPDHHPDFLQSRRTESKVTLTFVRAIYERLFQEACADTSLAATNTAGSPCERTDDIHSHRDKRQRLNARWNPDAVRLVSSAFAHMPLLVLPQPGNRPWKFAKAQEAFWQVEGSIASLPCSLWALENFYSGVRALGEDQRLNLHDFFTEVVGVPEVLTRDDLLSRCHMPNPSSMHENRQRRNAGRINPLDITDGSSVAEIGESVGQGFAAEGDDSKLRVTDLLGDDPFVLRQFFPTVFLQHAAPSSGSVAGATARSSRHSSPGSHGEDAATEEAALSAHVERCIHRLQSAELGDLFYSEGRGLQSKNSARHGEVALRRIEGWEHQGVRLYAAGSSMGACGPSELKRFGLVRSEGPHGGVAASPSLSTRAAAFADIVILPLAQVLQVPAKSIAAVVGPGVGRGCNVNGTILLGLACFKTSEGREERCRWFSEVCRLLADNGVGGFSASQLTAALVARHLPQLIELESSGMATGLSPM